MSSKSKTMKEKKEAELYKWMQLQRKNYKNKKLSQEQIDLMEKLPHWKWDSDDEWMEQYNLLKQNGFEE